jgi:hypothetical protein
METPRRAQQRLVPASIAPNSDSPAEKVSEEKRKYKEKKTPMIDLSRVPYPVRFKQQS